MTIITNYKKADFKFKSGNLIFFVNEKYDVSNLKKYFSSYENKFIKEIIKLQDLSKKIISFDLSSVKKIFLISLESNLNSTKSENLGAKFFNYTKEIKKKEFNINSNQIPKNFENFMGYFLHGFNLKSYAFEKYKSKKNNKKIYINVIGKNIPSLNDQKKFKAIEQGTFFARDLVSEPGNILHPDEYAKRLSILKKDGLKVTIYDEKN